MQTIQVRTPSAAYPVYLGHGLLQKLVPLLEKSLRSSADDPKLSRLPQRTFVLTSPEIWALWSTTFLQSFSTPPTVLFLPAGERYKTLASMEKLCRQLASAGADRSSLLIAFGGGIVGDVGGFLAAIYMRGIRFVQIPTTFLAQVDSSVGGKTGVNLPEGKNLVGAFHHPQVVVADLQLLSTLPDRELRAGLIESLKAGIIRDSALFRIMESHSDALLQRDPKVLQKVVAASIRMKADVVGADERESGLRMILNLGHTLGHALEAATGYRKLLHGEAVAWGTIVALEVALERGTITASQHRRMQDAILRYGPFPSLRLRAHALVALTARDKKHLGKLRRYVLPVGIGDATVAEDVSQEELMRATQTMLRMAAAGNTGVSA